MVTKKIFHNGTSLSNSDEQLSAYLDRIANALGHSDRIAPCKRYCAGLLLPIARKNVSTVAAALTIGNVEGLRQSLHHFVAEAPWCHTDLLREVQRVTLPCILNRGPVLTWDIREVPTRKGAAIVLSISTKTAALPVGCDLHMPVPVARNRERRQKEGVPDHVHYRSKRRIGLDMIRAAVENGLPRGVLRLSSRFETFAGSNNAFRSSIQKLGLPYLAPLRHGKNLRMTLRNRLATPRGMAMALPNSAWYEFETDFGDIPALSRFAVIPLAPMKFKEGNDGGASLVVEWRHGAPEPSRYWLSSLTAATPIAQLASLATLASPIDNAFQQLIGRFGFNRYQGRSWRGVQHHAALCIAAYGFLLHEGCC